uniref:Uncharacterized protein n=1 Tax=Rhizophora mucronata TaxID=61149 RepID=A0A2P2PUV9_RHIMU
MTSRVEIMFYDWEYSFIQVSVFCQFRIALGKQRGYWIWQGLRCPQIGLGHLLESRSYL